MTMALTVWWNKRLYPAVAGYFIIALKSWDRLPALALK
jgi:hypothetical protein